MNIRWGEGFALLATAVAVAACTTTASPYPASSRGDGWENFRADAVSGRSLRLAERVVTVRTPHGSPASI